MEYRLFLIPLIVVIINQSVKMLIEINRGEFKLPSLLSYGGMPSSHSAIVTSLVTVMAYYRGFDSADFAISLVVALLIIRDASGIRWQLGTHGKTINQLVKELPDDREYQFPVLSERFGHKNTEVMVGIILGLASTLLIMALWP